MSKEIRHNMVNVDVSKYQYCFWIKLGIFFSQPESRIRIVKFYVLQIQGNAIKVKVMPSFCFPRQESSCHIYHYKPSKTDESILQMRVHSPFGALFFRQKKPQSHTVSHSVEREQLSSSNDELDCRFLNKAMCTFFSKKSTATEITYTAVLTYLVYYW